MNLRHAILPFALALSLPAVADAARGFTVRDPEDNLWAFGTWRRQPPAPAPGEEGS